MDLVKPEAKIKEYIEHRMMREKQVLDTLHKGRNTIGGITEMIYVGVSPALQKVAEFSVQAHLGKADQGRPGEEEGAVICF